MTPFVSGALGAVTILLVAGLLRRAMWRRRFRHGPRGGWFLRRLFRRLRTRPEQEQVLSAEAESLAAELRAFRRDAWTIRAELADLLAAPALDTATISGALDARLAGLEALKVRVAEGVARIHATLDPAQRTELAALLRHGPHRFHHHPHHA
jgi:uncharacterized membrane protein